MMLGVYSLRGVLFQSILFLLFGQVGEGSTFSGDCWGTGIEFGSSAELTNHFSVVDSGASGTIAYSMFSGVAGLAGRLNISVPEVSGKMIYYKQPFSLREGGVTFSYHFLGEAFSSNSNARIALGISPDMVNLRSSARAQVRLINNVDGAGTFEIRSALSGSASTSGVELVTGNWYRLEGTFSLSETSGAVDVQARLIDCGVTGSMAQRVVAEASGTRSDSAFFTNGVAKDVYVGFFAQNQNGGATALDEIALPVFDFYSSNAMDRFEVVNESASGALTYSSNSGVGGVSGRVDCAGILSSSGEGLYGLSQIDPDDGVIGASFFFRAAELVNNGNYSRVALGLSPDQQNLMANVEVQARLLKSSNGNTATFEVRGGTGSNTTGVTLTDGHWYKLSATFVPYGLLSFQVDARLEDYGSDGAALVGQVATASAVKAAPADFFSGKDRLPVSIGLLVQNDGGGGDAIDQVCIPDSSPVAPSKGGNVFTWRRTIGSHYRLYPEARLGTIRSFPSPSKLSYYPDVTDLQPSNDLHSVIGHFSGEPRYYDFEGILVRTNIDLNYGEYLRQAESAHVDLIWNLGQIHYDHDGHVALIMSNGGKYYKDLVYQAVVYANTGEFEDSPTTVYWEIGNEINSADRFSLADYGDTINNLSNAVDYLEYYLAPAIEAIQAASKDIYQDPNHVKVLLGNISLLRTATTPDFLRTILDGIVVGTHAPTLAGKKGYELVSSIGIHYSKGTASVLDTYYNEWLATGKISNMWNTEEEGLAGLGDYDIVLHGFRWLDYWAQKTWSPEIARVQFWGDTIPTGRERSDGFSSETTGEEMEYFLGQLLKDCPLIRITPAAINLSATGSPEKYGFWAELPYGGYRAVLLVSAEQDWSLSSLNLPLPGAVKYCEAYKQSMETARALWDCSWQESGGTLTLTPVTSSLREEDEILVVIETKP